jgi:hypothetical protein
LLRAVKIWTPIEPRIEQTIWLIVLILCLIGGLTVLTGGQMTFPRLH